MSGGAAGLDSAVPVADMLACDVARALGRTPRQLPSQYLYDALGSALFEAICWLPWYKITRAEKDLLDKHAAEILAAAGVLSDVVELGPGSGEKLALLLGARALDVPLRVHLVDVSHEALGGAARRLLSLEGVRVVSHQALYEVGLAAARQGRVSGGRSLALLLGSNIGNFDPPGAAGLLASIHDLSRQGDCLLLGTDLIKPEPELLRAYEDPLGVTAAFNRNLLVRLNRELGADFDLAGFEHAARWHETASRVEMHLVSTRRQRIRVPRADLDFEMFEGESIWTESSYKYTISQVEHMLAQAGFAGVATWVEPDAQFALTLARREPSGAPQGRELA